MKTLIVAAVQYGLTDIKTEKHSLARNYREG